MTEKEIEKTLPLMFRARVKDEPEIIAQLSRDPAGWFTTRTYRQLYEELRWIAAGLLELGVKRGDLIGLISDNRQEWLAVDFGIMSIGAVDVPRGCDSTVQELAYILSFTGCGIVFAENQKQAEKILSIKSELPELKTIITFESADAGALSLAGTKGVSLYSYNELIDMGKTRRAGRPEEVDAEMDKGKTNDLVTIIFTSGTTGEPKGVMLTHLTFLHQLPCFKPVFDIKPADVWLSTLPVWHVFERAMEYVIVYYNSSIAYSKPISAVLMADFINIKPHWIVTVPRVWEAIMDGINRNVKQKGGFYKFLFDFCVRFGVMHAYFRDLTFGRIPNFHGRIRAFDAVMGFLPWLLLIPIRGLAYLAAFRQLGKRLGGRFKSGMSGGGALPSTIDRFFNGVGLRLVEGYGLTETSPVVAVRQYRKPRRNTVGQIFQDMEVKILDKEGRELPPGHNGIVYFKGPQIMAGYYKKPDLTKTALSPDGWLCTGDIGMVTRDNELRITGRAKDTIVLRGGENVEPVPVEQKIRECPHVHQCVVVGQDQKYIAALIVPKPEAIMAYAEENNIPIVDYDLLLLQPEITGLIASEIKDTVNLQNGFKSFERIYKFRLLPRPFEPVKELSPKMEPLRHKINANYSKEIQALFK